jgi:hypothetical protein
VLSSPSIRLRYWHPYLREARHETSFCTRFHIHSPGSKQARTSGCELRTTNTDILEQCQSWFSLYGVRLLPSPRSMLSGHGKLESEGSTVEAMVVTRCWEKMVLRPTIRWTLSNISPERSGVCTGGFNDWRLPYILSILYPTKTLGERRDVTSTGLKEQKCGRGILLVRT